MIGHAIEWLGNWLSQLDNIWMLIGFLGQGLFFSRFLIQWLRSEMVGKSVIPVAFWYFSISGGVVLLAYAIYREDPVIITGQAVGLLVYARNLYLINREKRGHHPQVEVETPKA